MQGYFSLVLHAHLPFVRHPEHEKFLEESWLFEAITETYLPLLQMLEGWRRDGMDARLTLSLSPTLCAMLLDPLLRERYERHLERPDRPGRKGNPPHALGPRLPRTGLDVSPPVHRHRATPGAHYDGNLVGAFRKFQDEGRWKSSPPPPRTRCCRCWPSHPPSLRAQILTARDHYRELFRPRPARHLAAGMRLRRRRRNSFCRRPTSAGSSSTRTACCTPRPRPRYGTFAPIFTPNGVAAFGRDFDSSRQVWSKHEGYPGDPRYRDFYRDIGFDLDFDYVKPHLPSPENRGFTGIKYYRITGGAGEKQIYERDAGLAGRRRTRAAFSRRAHRANPQSWPAFWTARRSSSRRMTRNCSAIGGMKGRSFWITSCAKLFTTRKSSRSSRPANICAAIRRNQIATPGASSWGEEGYWRVWLNETNEWIYPHLHIAQERMTELARTVSRRPTGLKARALRQAARELLLAQASDWPFILRAGTSPDYARRRVKDHLLRFIALHDQLTATGVDEKWLAEVESRDNLFPDVDWSYWK